jgi:hypothetical protein
MVARENPQEMASPDPHITRISLNDTEEKDRIFAEADLRWPHREKRSKGIKSIFHAIEFGENYLLVIRSGEGHLMGALSYNVDTSTGEARIFVHQVGVSLRNHGFGTKLMRVLMKIAAGLHYGIFLEALPDSEQFFRRIGMHESRDTEVGHLEFTPEEVRRIASATGA